MYRAPTASYTYCHTLALPDALPICARNEIGLADRADDAAQCGVGRFHIGLFRSGGFRRNVLLHLIEHCNCRHSAADPERAAVTAQPAEATMMQAIAIHCVVLSRSPRMRKPASATEIGRAHV